MAEQNEVVTMPVTGVVTGLVTVTSDAVEVAAAKVSHSADLAAESLVLAADKASSRLASEAQEAAASLADAATQTARSSDALLARADVFQRLFEAEIQRTGIEATVRATKTTSRGALLVAAIAIVAVLISLGALIGTIRNSRANTCALRGVLERGQQSITTNPAPTGLAPELQQLVDDGRARALVFYTEALGQLPQIRCAVKL